MRPLVIAADDYALSEAVDRGILRLVEQGRLTAASCLTMHPRWAKAAKAVTQSHRQQADIGLHLDFTEFSPTRQRLPLLILQSKLRLLNESQIIASIHVQLDRFEQAMDTPPDYIDGHQHIHQLPQIRHALLEAMHARYGQRQPWLRISRPPASDGLKGRIITWLGAAPLSRHATPYGIPCSTSLLGVYDFSETASYPDLLKSWCRLATEDAGRPVVMCHPATADARDTAGNDPIFAARLKEYAVLSSDTFADLLQEYQLKLARGSQIFKQTFPH